MDTAKTLYQRLQSIEDEILKLNNTIFALKTTDIQKYRRNYEDLSVSAALRAERIACQMRNLVYIADVRQASGYMQLAAHAHGIRIEAEGDILSIHLPGLLPKRKVRTNTSFLYEPLRFAMQEYLKDSAMPLYRDCVVCFSQVYNKELSLERVRDYDNVEFKQILDTIAGYVLTDDTGLFCDLYHTTELGESDCTYVYIMEKATFPSWIKARKNHIETLSEIS